MSENRSQDSGVPTSKPPSSNRVILAQRSLIRGVISRAEEISHTFCDPVDILSEENDRKATNAHMWSHRLKIRDHCMLDQKVGFWLETHDTSQPGIRVFFDGMSIVIFLCKNYQDRMGTPLCKIGVFEQSEKGSPFAIAGILSEMDFWENELERTLKECIKFITPYTTKNGGISTHNSIYTEKEFIDALDKFSLSEDSDTELSLSLDKESNRVIISRKSPSEGVSYSEISASKMSDSISKWKSKARIMPVLDNKYQRFIHSLIEGVGVGKRESFARDEDGNLLHRRAKRVKTMHSKHSNMDEVSTIVESYGQVIVTKTASEIIKESDKHHKEHHDIQVARQCAEETKKKLEERMQTITRLQEKTSDIS